jgi:hypothetical protein
MVQNIVPQWNNCHQWENGMPHAGQLEHQLPSGGLLRWEQSSN